MGDLLETIKGRLIVEVLQRKKGSRLSDRATDKEKVSHYGIVVSSGIENVYKGFEAYFNHGYVLDVVGDERDLVAVYENDLLAYKINNQ